MWKLLPPEPAVVPALSPAQVEAARPRPGVTVVVGGPGSGKSRTLVESVVQRVEGGVPLSKIAVLAGSRAAAQSLRREVIGRINKAQAVPVFTTAHGLALGLLRQFQPADEEPWVLLRAPQQEQRIRELLAGGVERWPEDLRPALSTSGFARQVREFLARVRQRSWDEHDLSDLARRRDDHVLGALASFFDEYLAVGDLERTLDYAELIYRARLMTTEPDVMSAIRDRFEAILVDDAHDLDLAQSALLGDFAALGIPLAVFGDPQQAVSGFRGATSEGMLSLLEHRPSVQIDLPETHRHGQPVAEALAALRSRMDARQAPEPPESAVTLAGEVTVRVFDDEVSEAEHVADGLRRAVADGAEWRDLAVIMRAGRAQLAPMARELLRLGIPVEVAADELVLAEEASVVTLLLALKVAANGGEPSTEEAHRLLASPLGGLDAVALRRLGRHLLEAHPERGNSIELVRQCLVEPALLVGEGDELTAARGLAALLSRAAAMLDSGDEVQMVLWELWSGTPWPDALRTAALEGSRRADHELDAVVELFERAAKEPVRAGRGAAHTFIRELAGEEIGADTGRELALAPNAVQLTTAHRAKGREWPRVWVAGVQEGRWPRVTLGALLLDPGHLLDGEPRTVGELVQEERRLFHLACSRASTHLHVSASIGADETSTDPSRFLKELGHEPERVEGRPARPLTAGVLVGTLRKSAGALDEPEVLRRGAAQRLAQLAGRGVSAADPTNWWGRPETSPVPEPGEEFWFSGSSLNELLRCPRKYFLSKKAKVQEPRNVRASVGDVVHLVAKHAQQERLDLEAMRKGIDAVWDRIPFEAEWLREAERADIDECLIRLSNWFEEYDDELLAVEQPFRVRIDVAGRPVVLHGTADRIDILGRGSERERLRIVDLKTGAKRSPSDVAEDIQLGVYQLAAREGAFAAQAPGVTAIDAPALLFLRHGKGDLPVVVEQSALGTGHTWVHEKIEEAIEILDSGSFPAVENEFCDHCPFRAGCPALTKEPT